MNERFMPSLKHIVLVKITSTLWNQRDIIALIKEKINKECGILGTEFKWNRIENKVEEKVSLLPQPQSLKEKILGIVKPIGLEIFQWWEGYRNQTYGSAVNWPNKFYFTPRGTLDRQKTAKTLMGNETIDIMERYYMACYHCLQDDVKKLWGKMTENGRNPFERKFYYGVKHKELAHFLTTFEYKGYHTTCTPYEWAFDRAVKDCNKVAVEYFFSKLTPSERETELRHTINMHSLTLIICKYSDDIGRLSVGDILCFIHSQLNEEQQLKLIEQHPRELLSSFLRWPRQGLFMGMTNHVKVFLRNEDYYLLLHEIVEKVKDGFKDYDYQKLFREFWLESDITLKKYVINESAKKEDSNLLICLLMINDMKNICLILKDATLEEKENIVLNVGAFFCYRCENWDMIHIFLSEVIPSRETLIKFKDECKSKWYLTEKFFEQLDEHIQKWNEKRSEIEISDCTPTKRFCSSSNVHQVKAQ